MRIYSMTATFGKLERTTLTLQPGLNVIEAPNEWGKSTWCAFLVAMLYGIETRVRSTTAALADKEHYAPWSGAPMEGRIDLCWNGRDITIERRTKGRSVMGEFRAYETGSGITVPELNGDNCGKMLLGVEKSVFTRTGFIRLTDMPVTQDEALRRRLNELVTTGDESGQSDDLAQKLRDLKNRVRANRANGLIPQALSEKANLESKLQQLDTLQAQVAQLKDRQSSVADFAARLQNHKQALIWAAAEDYAKKAADAKARLTAAEERVAQLEEACRTLPTEEQLQAQVLQVRQLQNQKDDLQLALAMLPAPPTAPQVSVTFGEHAVQQAKQDFESHQALSAVGAPGKGLMVAAIIAAILALAGAGLALATMNSDLLALTIAGAAMFVLFGLAAAWCGRIYRNKNKACTQAQQQLQELKGRYGTLSAADWVAAAVKHEKAQADYQTAQAQYEENRKGLQEQLQQVMAQLAQCPDVSGHSAAMEQRRALADALREKQHLQHLVQTLESTGSLPEQPKLPDTLTYSEPETARLLSDAEAEARQLHKHLGQLEGQMQALGSREILQNQLTAVNQRLARLEKTYAALELAQNTLTEAATVLQRRFAPAIAQKATEYFSRITAGRYDKLALTEDLTVHAAAADEVSLQSSLWRSDGTVDQLYLALRLAVAEALTPDAPLVLDDALVRFDDHRLAQTMALLKDAAGSKQVILFTCQSRETQYL